MRQFRTRASCSRFLLVVATLFVLTLAASSPISSAVSAHVLGTSASPLAAVATADCSKAAATEIVLRLQLNDPEVAAKPVYKVLCGSFTGSGSETMVLSISGPGSTGMLDWVVFRWTGDTWQLLMKQHQAAVLTAAGSDIRETVSIFRDPRASPRSATASSPPVDAFAAGPNVLG